MAAEPSTQDRRKEIVNEFFRLVKEGRPQEGLRFFSPDCKQHNPYIHGGMTALTDAMIAAFKEGSSKYPEASFTVNQLLADGDMLAVHTELLSSKSKPSDGGLRQVHLFRFNGDKIVEYWNVTQQILPSMPNSVNAFSF